MIGCLPLYLTGQNLLNRVKDGGRGNIWLCEEARLMKPSNGRTSKPQRAPVRLCQRPLMFQLKCKFFTLLEAFFFLFNKLKDKQKKGSQKTDVDVISGDDRRAG